MIKAIYISALFLSISLSINAQISIGLGLDPTMLIREKTIDLRINPYYRFDRFELGFIYENVPKPFSYNGLSLCWDAIIIDRFIQILAGPEVTRIWNKESSGDIQNVIGYGINGQLRFLLTDKFSFALIGNYKERPELDRYVFSGYFSLTYKFIRHE